ncbi:MAG: hypothetical protein WAQ52_02275 [Terriglobales bacterium]
MSRSLIDRLYRISRALGLAALLGALVATLGCGGAISSPHNAPNGDPLGLGVEPGPLGSTDPQTIEVRVGSEPSDRIVSLSLTISSVQATNSGAQNLELLTDPITVEFTRSAIVTEPVVIRDIYQDTYSALIFPDMTGQVVFYDSNGQLATQSLNVTGRTVALSPNLVLGADPEVLSISLDLAQTFTVGTNSVTVNPIVVTAQSAVPAPAVAPAVGQPETGSVNFLVGTVTNVDTTAHVISLLPASGDAMQVSYDNSSNGTVFVNCSPSMLTGMMVETQGATQSNGGVLATQVALIDNSQSNSELYGLLSGYAPDGINYNLIVEGGLGVNVTTGLIGKNVTLDWLGASYSVNAARLDLTNSQDLVFDEIHVFPGQLVEVKQDTLIVPDPDSSNAGLMSPQMIELEEQTISGQVSGYNSLTGVFTLNVAANSFFKTMNPGLISITVRQVSQTFLRNSPTFNDGDTVKVRGLLFVHPDYSNVNQPPNSPVAFIMVADRISQ